MAKPDGKVFTPARSLLGIRTPVTVAATAATDATIAATSSVVAEEDMVLGSMHKGKFVYFIYPFSGFPEFMKSLQAVRFSISEMLCGTVRQKLCYYTTERQPGGLSMSLCDSSGSRQSVNSA